MDAKQLIGAWLGIIGLIALWVWLLIWALPDAMGIPRPAQVWGWDFTCTLVLGVLQLLWYIIKLALQMAKFLFWDNALICWPLTIFLWLGRHRPHREDED